MKNKGHNKMDYSRPGPGKGILKRSGLQNSSTNHRSHPTHKTDGSLRLRDEDSPVRERAKPFSHNPSFQRSGSKKRKRNGDLEDHLEVNSPLIDTHTNDLEVNSPLTDILTNDLQSEEHIGSTSNGTTVTRKETRALSAAKRSRLNNRKLVFEVDQCAGRIVGDDSQVFITKGGCLVRERAKFDGTTWRKQEPSLKTDIIAKCVENSSFNGNCKSMVHAIDTQLASQHKSRRWRLHNHYKTYPTKEQAVMNPPKGVKVPDWVLLCERFASEDFQGQENEENDGSDDDDDGDDGRENEENEEYEESDDDNDGQENEENAGSDDDGQENEENVGSDDDGQEHQDFI